MTDHDDSLTMQVAAILVAAGRGERSGRRDKVLQQLGDRTALAHAIAPFLAEPRVTTTPLQALALMNNSFVQRQADHLAERALAESNQNLPAAIQTAYRLALGRSATREESKRALAAAKQRDFVSVCWALLNSTEFVYVR